MAREAAIAELNRCSGTQFDGDVVVAFLAELADGTLMDEASAL
jgi:HD-GYP domain-containing protein (c-di-GMP phosphodiesterase class II)